MKKSKIIAVVLEHLRADFERRQSAAKRTREQGNDAENKSEGKYDTRSTEENYLADGLARQALEAATAAEAIEKMPIRDFAAGEGIDIGALVELEFAKETEFFLIATAGGGTEVVWNKKTIVVLTPESPLGSQLIGRHAGERAGDAKIKQVF
jgi:transcription elongation GreA/GreB family factor